MDADLRWYNERALRKGLTPTTTYDAIQESLWSMAREGQHNREVILQRSAELAQQEIQDLVTVAKGLFNHD